MNASRPEKTLTPKQRIALIALASGERPQLVAARARISIRTLYRWRANPAFQQALAAALDNYHENFPQEEAAARILDRAAYSEMSATPRSENRQAT